MPSVQLSDQITSVSTGFGHYIAQNKYREGAKVHDPLFLPINISQRRRCGEGAESCLSQRPESRALNARLTNAQRRHSTPLGRTLKSEWAVRLNTGRSHAMPHGNIYINWEIPFLLLLPGAGDSWRQCRSTVSHGLFDARDKSGALVSDGHCAALSATPRVGRAAIQGSLNDSKYYSGRGDSGARARFEEKP